MGHIRAAEALQSYCRVQYPTIVTEHFNAAEYSGWLLNTSLVKSYEFLIKNYPKVFGALFKMADTRLGKKYIELHHPLLKKSGEPLLAAIARFAPDRIIVTHPIIMPLLEDLPATLPTDLVITDYYANKIWLHPRVRHLFVATPEMKRELGGEHSSITVSGIPLHPVFFEHKNLTELYQKYHLPADRPFILSMSGGQGLIDTSDMVKELLTYPQPLNIIAVAGKGSKKVLSNFRKLSSTIHYYQAIEFTTAIDEYMRLADVIITKPGGLTVTECLYLKKPMILINPIPGQEEANAEYITKHHFGFKIDSSNEINKLLHTILTTRDALASPPDRPNPNELIINCP